MKEKTTRKNIRLKDFDYSETGYYFVTICTATKEHILGEISTGNVGVDAHIDPCNFSQIDLSPIGKIVSDKMQTMDKIKNCKIDCFVIMPNHVHAVIKIVGADAHISPHPIKKENGSIPTKKENGSMWASTPTPLSQMIKSLKALTSKRAGFSFWQRNYHERIIRNEEELNNIRQYIIDNPAKWIDDPYNLKR